MTSASVSEIKTYFVGNVASDNTRSQEVSGSDSFSQVFSKTNDSQADYSSRQTTSSDKTDTADKSSTSDIRDNDSIQNHANIQNSSSQKIKDKADVQDRDDPTQELTDEDLAEKAAEAGAVMVTQVAETFQVTEDAVQEAMDELNLTAVDLLDSANLTKLATALTPEADALTVMTDEQLFSDVKGLMNTAQELVNDLTSQGQLSPEELADLLEQVRNSQLTEETPEITTAPDNAAAFTEAVEDVEPATVIPVTVEKTDTTAVRSQDNSTEVTAEPVETTDRTDTQQDVKERSSEQDDSHSDEHQSGTRQTFAQTVVDQLNEQLDQIAETQTTYGVDTQDIMEQITEYIRVQVKPETTEMELQLHPASLGNIKVQVASREGVLTASFTTQNEAVKAALESQMVQLKESFEQQGIKVEAIEVNVEARGFERSLDQQNQEQSRDQFTEGSRRGTRRIRLGGGSEEELDDEDLTEEDRIVADMMIRNGNTVDYTA